MKILGKIGEENNLGKLRQAIRVVLFDENNNIAVGHYLPKEKFPKGQYHLPGGGVKESESIKEALIREAKEETGCKIKDIQELGIIKEYGVGKMTKHDQDTYCFKAKVDGEKLQPKFTEREITDQLEVKWLSVDELLNIIENQELSFDRTRNLIILNSLK